MATMGGRVKALRDALGLSQTELARRVGIKQPSMSSIENDKTTNLSGKVLDGLCRELRTTSAYILKGEGAPSAPDFQVERLKAWMEGLPNLSADAIRLGRDLDSISDPEKRYAAYQAATLAIQAVREGRRAAQGAANGRGGYSPTQEPEQQSQKGAGASGAKPSRHSKP